MAYTISEIAKKSGIAPSAIRYYDSEGLLGNVGRSSGGTRILNDDDFEKLKLIEALKKAGLSLGEIKTYFDKSTSNETKKEMLEEKISQLESTLTLLKAQSERFAKQKEEQSSRTIKFKVSKKKPIVKIKHKNA